MRILGWCLTGWGPRGDSGPARGRVRATQPASFSFHPRPIVYPLFLGSQTSPNGTRIASLFMSVRIAPWFASGCGSRAVT
jgi:hypothetical protein